MLRHGVVLGIGLVFSASSMAQTSWGTSDGWSSTNMPGTVISQSNKKGAKAIKTVSAKVPEAVEPIAAPVKQPIATPVNQAMGGTSTCSDPSTCDSCSKSKKGCWTRFKDWLCFRGSPAPCDCKHQPTLYTPPLYTFFPCKPNPLFMHNPNPWKAPCDSNGCGKSSCISKVEEPRMEPPLMPTTPPNMMPTPSRIPMPIQPMSPNVPKSTTMIPKNNPSVTTVSRYTPVSMGSASAFAIDQSMEEQPKIKQPQPLSVYSSGSSVKTCSDSTISKEMAPPQPKNPSVFDKVWIPGYRRMGGPKE